MSRREATSRKRSISLTAQMLLIQMVGSAEWVQNNKKPISCPFSNKEPKKYGFDITKADKIFDLLVSEGQIKLKPYHTIPTD